MRNKTMMKWLMGSSTILFLQAPVFAQGTLEEIIITAQKRTESLQDVPIAVTAIGADQLSSANIEGSYTLPKLTPTMNITRIASFASVYIRGVGTQFANPGFESSTSVYFDDTYIPRASNGMFSFNDIERIEVLKGPQGTLYGRNATGGAIRIITNDPKDYFEANIAGGFGTDNRRLVEGMINIPISDTLALRIAGRTDRNDGFADNNVPGTREDSTEDRDEQHISAKLLFTPNDSLRIKLSGDYAEKHDSEGHTFINLQEVPTDQVGLALGGCGSTGFYDYCNDLGQGVGPNSRYAGQNIRQFGGQLRIDYETDNHTFSSITGYRENNENNYADLDSTGANIIGSAGLPLTEQFTQEFQITSSGDGDLSYVTGLYYLEEKSGYYFALSGFGIDGNPDANIFGLPLGFSTFGGDGNVEVKSWAPYAQFDWKFAENFNLTIGLRYTWEEKELVDNDLVFGPVADDGFVNESMAFRLPFEGYSPIGINELDLDYEEFTPKISLSWFATDDLMVYGTVARGYKSGGINLPAFGVPQTADSEFIDSFELGWKYESGSIRFNGAAFIYKYDDLQITITDQDTGGTRVANAAKADIWGLEADVIWAATEALELGAGIGYLNTEYNDFIGDAYTLCRDVPNLPENTAEEIIGKNAGLMSCGDQGGLGLALVGGQDLSGNELVNSPEFAGYLRAQYIQDIDQLGSITYSAIIHHQDSSFYDPANFYEEDARTTVSANITWLSTSEKYYISVYGENLTDEEFNTINAPQADGGWRVPGPPRQVYLKAGVKF